jgi:hypothetical protein
VRRYEERYAVIDDGAARNPTPSPSCSATAPHLA